jgi:hypothetical protein
MKSAVFSATDLVFNTPKERFYYPKGAMIQLEVGNDQDVYVVHHRLQQVEDEEGKKETSVLSTNLRVVRLEDLNFILDSTVFESQLSPAIDFKDVNMDEALFSERLSPAMISRYLTDSMSAVEKTYTKDKVQYIRIPIRSKKENLGSKDKMKLLQKFDQMETKNIKSEDILSIDARSAGNANETGYLVSVESLLGNTNADLLGYLESKLVAGLPEEWKVRRTKESKLRVDTKGARPAPISTFLSTLPIKTELNVINDDGTLRYEVSVATPGLTPVLETYYTRTVPYEKYTQLELNSDGPEEGDPCTTEDGKKGVLQKQGDKMICMVKESYTPNFREAAAEGDPCEANGKKGTMKRVNGALACMVKEVKITKFEIPSSSNVQEGDEYIYNNDLKGKVVKEANGKLVGQVSETVETEAFTAPMVKLEAEFGGDGEGSNSAAPAPGDDCAVAGKPGKLVLINGALICELPGQPNSGRDGAN